MKAIKVQIVKFIDDHQPGFVECRFFDAMSNEHIVEEKVPVVTSVNLNEYSLYPLGGVIACEILSTKQNQDGKLIATVTTSKPWGVETIEGITQFDIFEEQLTEID